MSDDCCDDDWIRERIAAKKTLIGKIEEAITAVAAGAQSYQIDTGQTRQMVNRGNVGSYRIFVQGLESDIATLQARLGCGRLYVRPSW